MDAERLAEALRQLAKGFAAAAAALDPPIAHPPQEERVAAVLRDWGDRGLSRRDTSDLFRRHGFAPQTSGGWANGDWIESRPDGLRYITTRSRTWLAERDGERS